MPCWSWSSCFESMALFRLPSLTSFILYPIVNTQSTPPFAAMLKTVKTTHNIQKLTHIPFITLQFEAVPRLVMIPKGTIPLARPRNRMTTVSFKHQCKVPKFPGPKMTKRNWSTIRLTFTWLRRSGCFHGASFRLKGDNKMWIKSFWCLEGSFSLRYNIVCYVILLLELSPLPYESIHVRTMVLTMKLELKPGPLPIPKGTAT